MASSAKVGSFSVVLCGIHAACVARAHLELFHDHAEGLNGILVPNFFLTQQVCIRGTAMVPEEDTVIPSRLTKLTAHGNVQHNDLVEEVWLRERLAKKTAARAPPSSRNIIPSIRTSRISFQYTNNPPLKN